MPSSPSVATGKRLFALSGNRCAFPKCITPMIDLPSGSVLGEVCHIEAERPGGARYRAAMTDEARHAFDNLLLMCAIHHKIVDDDPESYTVARLRQIKLGHEQRGGGGPSAVPSDAAVERLIQVTSNVHGTGNVVSIGQMGGQTAHSITNIGRIDRTISQATASSMVAALRAHPPTRISLSAAYGDAEAYRLAEALRQVVVGAGWDAGSVNIKGTVPPMQGLALGLPRMYLDGQRIKAELVPAQLVSLTRLLGQVGLAPSPFQVEGIDDDVPELLVGSQ